MKHSHSFLTYYLKFRLSENVSKRDAVLAPVTNSQWPRIFRITGANQNTRKLLFTDLVNELPQVKLNETALQAFWEPSTE